MEEESDELELEYKRLLIEDIKLAIKRKRLLNMMDKYEFWKVLEIEKELESREKEYNKRHKKESLHV